MTSGPGVDKQIADNVPLDRYSGQPLQRRLDVLGLDVACAVQPAQSGENLGIEMGWCMQSVAREPPANGATSSLPSRRSTIADASTTISVMACRGFVGCGIQRSESTVVGNH